MPTHHRVAVLIGSLREQSFNRKIVHALDFLSTGLEFHPVDFHDLPMMNEDIEVDPPKEWLRFRAEIAQADAYLFATPEYNRSVPGTLKNAIDVGSRPYGANLWNDKPAAIISASIGQIGGFGATHHLRQILSYLNVHVMDQPEVYISDVARLFDEQGTITDVASLEFLQSVADSFSAWIERQRAVTLVTA